MVFNYILHSSTDDQVINTHQGFNAPRISNSTTFNTNDNNDNNNINNNKILPTILITTGSILFSGLLVFYAYMKNKKKLQEQLIKEAKLLKENQLLPKTTLNKVDIINKKVDPEEVISENTDIDDDNISLYNTHQPAFINTPNPIHQTNQTINNLQKSSLSNQPTNHQVISQHNEQNNTQQEHKDTSFVPITNIPMNNNNLNTQKDNNIISSSMQNSLMANANNILQNNIILKNLQVSFDFLRYEIDNLELEQNNAMQIQNLNDFDILFNIAYKDDNEINKKSSEEIKKIITENAQDVTFQFARLQATIDKMHNNQKLLEQINKYPKIIDISNLIYKNKNNIILQNLLQINNPNKTIIELFAQYKKESNNFLDFFLEGKNHIDANLLQNIITVINNFITTIDQILKKDPLTQKDKEQINTMNKIGVEIKTNETKKELFEYLKNLKEIITIYKQQINNSSTQNL